ncbi:MAG: CobW family GTP-binding protein [Mangrovibacterium sp.]
METERIPVTIITGFLGAGKTTLINKIISRYPQKKFAVIENEFGEIGIDGGLIIGTGENIFELTNGCICCSLRDDLYETLTLLLGNSFEFDHLLVETTGIADPGNIINAFLSTELMQSRFVIDSMICLADAIFIEDLLTDQPEVQCQLALSDKILINKTDCVQPVYVEKLRNRLSEMNPMAEIYSVSYANIEAIRLLDTYSYSAGEIKKTLLAFQYAPQQLTTDTPKPSSLIRDQEKKHHRHMVTAKGFRIPGKFDLGKFSLWIETFLFFNADSMFRIKGLLNFDEFPGSFIFQAVRDKFVFEESEAFIPENKLVFIGKNIHRDDLEKSLFQLIKEETVKQ